MAGPSIYLDHNATTPIDPAVLDAMAPIWRAGGNPESRHAAGRAARRAWEQARESVSRILGAFPDEVVFTSGGTEANNLALFGLGLWETGSILTSPIEHPAVSEAVGRLAAGGMTVETLPIDDQGRALVGPIPFGTRLATLMLANNETGAIQPVADLARLAHDQEIPVHTDAVQAVGRIAVDFHGLGVATLAASAHKFHGPAGVGVLLVRKGIKLAPRIFGGGQQGGRRPGTPAVALAVGMARALEVWNDQAVERTSRWERLRDRLESGMIDRLGRARVIRNGPIASPDRLPQTVNLGFPGLDGDALLMQLDLAGVAASLGSACASGASEPSTTLMAMRVPPDRLRSSVRFSLGAGTTESEIDQAVERVAAVVDRIAAAEPTSYLL